MGHTGRWIWTRKSFSTFLRHTPDPFAVRID